MFIKKKNCNSEAPYRQVALFPGRIFAIKLHPSLPSIRQYLTKNRLFLFPRIRARAKSSIRRDDTSIHIRNEVVGASRFPRALLGNLVAGPPVLVTEEFLNTGGNSRFKVNFQVEELFHICHRQRDCFARGRVDEINVGINCENSRR